MEAPIGKHDGLSSKQMKHLNVQPNSRRFVMKSFILAAIVALSGITAGVATANADSFTIHGYQGTHYGR